MPDCFQLPWQLGALRDTVLANEMSGSLLSSCLGSLLHGCMQLARQLDRTGMRIKVKISRMAEQRDAWVPDS